MNIEYAFFNNNGQLNWDAISTISNIILATLLVIITLWSVIQVKKQTRFMKIDRLANEMDKLVAPLYSKIGNNIIFQKGSEGYLDHADSNHPRDQMFFRFWDEIKHNKYLGPDYLRSAIDNYLRNKSTEVHDKTQDAPYKKAENELFEAIKIRYSELEDELAVLKIKS